MSLPGNHVLRCATPHTVVLDLPAFCKVLKSLAYQFVRVADEDATVTSVFFHNWVRNICS